MDKKTWLEKWNSNFKNDDFVYGKSPNEFFKEIIDKIEPQSILLAAEGEGRNAVYAAKNGWKTYAFDISSEGKRKAEVLAEENNVKIDYSVGELPDLKYEKEQFDAVALIYAHFPPEIKSQYHKILTTLLKKDGIIIFEAFSKNHLEYRRKNEKVGGPQDIESLFSIEELKNDFKNFNFEILEETEVDLQEGLFHNGKGSVIRFVGFKK